MRPTMVLCSLAASFAATCLCGAALAAINIPSDGSDGAFSPAANVEVDLSQAVAGVWNVAGNGKGRYDGGQWAVVFKYTSVNIPAGVTVTFKNHASRAPVVWLVRDSVNIAGTIKLDGAPATNNATPAEPGSGGFRGGIGGGDAVKWSAGFGYGGGDYRTQPPGASGSYRTTGTGSGGWLYGSPALVPLMGGSGGAGTTQLRGGGAGGGAILIACRNTISLGGGITANGGPSFQGGGAGGGIRLVADLLTGGGSLSAKGAAAQGWQGGDGAIRLEANQSTMTGTAAPAASVGLPIGNDPDIFPPASAPRLVITQVAGANAPADPRASLQLPGQDVSVAVTGQVKVRLQATNVPSTWTVLVRVMPRTGSDGYAVATKISGTDASSVYEATVTLPAGMVSLTARAYP